MDKEKVLSTIQGYAYYAALLAEINERLESISYKTTATYGNLAPSAGGGLTSDKVADMGNRRHELTLQKERYKAKLAEVRHMIGHSGLTKQERGVMWWIARCGQLAAYARRENIGKDNVYKIRDRAVNKIIAAQKPQKEVQ